MGGQTHPEPPCPPLYSKGDRLYKNRRKGDRSEVDDPHPKCRPSLIVSIFVCQVETGRLRTLESSFSLNRSYFLN